MHILIIADPIDNQKAGVHTYTKNLIRELLKIGDHKYTFIHNKENPFFENTNHQIIPIKKTLGYGTYRKFFLIPSLIRKLNPDIVLEPCHIGPFRVRAKRAVMIHDLTPILMPNLHIKRSTIIHKLFLKRILKNADIILTASDRTKQDIKNYSHTKAKIETIPLGIKQIPNELSNTEFFLKNGYPKPKVVRPPDMKDPYLLYLGTIEPRKNLETLIDAFVELKKSNKIPHKLILAGEIGWKAKKILEKAKHLDIIMTNHVSEDEKEKLYANADIFIYPSLYEGFGLPPLEAMNHNVPVICSNGGSLKELYENYALMFDPKDKEQLKRHIVSLLENNELRQNLVEKAKPYSQKFTWKKTAERTLQALSGNLL
ncbi:MAG: glycosyltransferase family 1 protein [bacterium]|nr:glycosyltransferase family 1 protein [bacterium]